MGKKKKGGGAEKTAAKTDKKMASKMKKNLALTGEEDIEKIVAQIEREEQKKVQVIEKLITSPPTCRAFFTLVAHPEKDELIMFGGEYYNGKETEVFNDLFTYKIGKDEWRIVKGGAGPGPRSGHAAIALPFNRGEMWLFGGEYTTKTESQFYHYNDLWTLNLETRTWNRITAGGGPCSRSGHRMVAVKKQLVLFGGYQDNLHDYKYFNDVFIFNLETKTWHKIVPSGSAPAPRSACQMVATPEGKVLIWGGYSKVKVKKDVDSGVVHSDMFLLSPDKGDDTGLKWKWSSIKPGGTRPEPLSGISFAVNPASGRAYTFGGALDTETEEDIQTQFFNDLYSIDLSKYIWSRVSISCKKDAGRPRRRQHKKTKEEPASDEDEIVEDMDIQEGADVAATCDSVVDDGVFRLEVGGKGTVCNSVASEGESGTDLNETGRHPHPRSNAGLVIKSSKLFLYGGIFETSRVMHTLSDFHLLDLQKLDEWKTLVSCDLAHQEWLESSSDSESDSQGEFDCDSNDSSESCD